MIPKSGNRFSEKDHAPESQSSVARPRSFGSRAASIQSVRFGVAARNTLCWPQKLRFNSARANSVASFGSLPAASRDQPIERAGDHAAIDQFRAGVAEPAADVEARLIEAAGEAQAAALAARRVIGERLDQNGAEFRVDDARRSRSVRQPQLGDACRDVVVVRLIGLAAAMDFDHGGRAARLAECQDVLAPAAAGVAPDGVARRSRTPGSSSQMPETAC